MTKINLCQKKKREIGSSTKTQGILPKHFLILKIKDIHIFAAKFHKRTVSAKSVLHNESALKLAKGEFAVEQ